MSLLKIPSSSWFLVSFVDKESIRYFVHEEHEGTRREDDGRRGGGFGELALHHARFWVHVLWEWVRVESLGREAPNGIERK